MYGLFFLNLGGYMFKKYLIMVLCLASPLVADNGATKQKMLNFLDTVRSDFETGYAPKEWKKEFINWDLNEQYEIAKNQILSTENITTTEFQQILKGFFLSTRDHHVGIRFFSTETAELPISIRSVDNRVFIVHVDYDRINSGLFPISPGDEIVSFNGKPAMEALIDFQKESYHSSEEGSDRALAQTFFCNRDGQRGQEIPSGPITIEVRSGDSQNTRAVQLCWEYTPEMVTSDISHYFSEENHILPDLQFIDMDDPQTNYFDDNPFAKGSRNSYLPCLGKKIWETSEYDLFEAYIYQTKNRELVGFIRLPSYSPFIPEFFFEAFKDVIDHFQGITDALIIDQTNNPGGSLLYLYAIASLLTDKPLSAPKHKFSINQEHVFEAFELLKILDKIANEDDARDLFGESIHGYTISYQFVQILKGYCRFIISEWKAGRTLTNPHYLYGVDRINPHPSVNYTKPILLLVDEWDFSGGDFFPAIMQDNKRAVIMGTRTAGAGGYVRNRVMSNVFGVMMYRFTESIAVRENSEYLENLGVKPDVDYKWTVEDVRGGFGDYADAINEVMNVMLNPESTSASASNTNQSP